MAALPLEKSPDAFRTISEVGELLDVPQHVLRFWETRFDEISPLKRGGGRRYYRPQDIALLQAIHHFLYAEGYTIRGVQRILKDQGVKALVSAWKETPKDKGRRPSGSSPVMLPASRIDDSASGHRIQSPVLSAVKTGEGSLILSPADIERLMVVLEELASCRQLIKQASV